MRFIVALLLALATSTGPASAWDVANALRYPSPQLNKLEANSLILHGSDGITTPTVFSSGNLFTLPMYWEYSLGPFPHMRAANVMQTFEPPAGTREVDANGTPIGSLSTLNLSMVSRGSGVRAGPQTSDKALTISMMCINFGAAAKPDCPGEKDALYIDMTTADDGSDAAPMLVQAYAVNRSGDPTTVQPGPTGGKVYLYEGNFGAMEAGTGKMQQKGDIQFGVSDPRGGGGSFVGYLARKFVGNNIGDAIVVSNEPSNPGGYDAGGTWANNLIFYLNDHVQYAIRSSDGMVIQFDIGAQNSFGTVVSSGAQYVYANGTQITSLDTSGNFTTKGTLAARGIYSRAGINGTSSGANVNIQWDNGKPYLWIDATRVGQLLLQ